MHDGKARQMRSRFRLATSVDIMINAPAATIWSLLTDLGAHRTWNSTLRSIDGKVALGEKISFAVPKAPTQTFSPTVAEYEEGTSMVWRLSVGPLLRSDRTYRLEPGPGGSTVFHLDEVFRGPLLPLVVRTFPDFRRMFEQTAADLKAAAETPAASA